jgi:ribosome recycling factor
MALTGESIRRAVQRKAQRARQQVLTAEHDLATANKVLKQAIPRHDVEAMVHAAERTAAAEDEVRAAAHELQAVDELLETAQPGLQPAGGASGEGADSVLPYLGRRV